MTYEETLEYIHGVYWRGSKLGLERIRELLERMGNPQRALRFVHIAGTNGKGSTCALLSAILQQQGYRTGLYISPYLERFNERIQVDGKPISDEALCAVTAFVREHAEIMPDLPTEFEIVCAIGFEYFRREACDIVVLEVGLGGRLDATNVIPPPLLAVLAAIDYDHTEYLGGTLAEIAAEKCGIIKPGSRVVSYEQLPEAAAVVSAVCARQRVPLTVCDFSALSVRRDDLLGQVFDYGGKEHLAISLAGAHQRRNAAVAIEAARALDDCGLPVSDAAVRRGLAAARWPGRFEPLCLDPLVVVDGGHNPQGIAAAVEAARQYLRADQTGGLVIVTGMMADKNTAAMLDCLNGVALRFIATRPGNPRALDPAELGQRLNVYGKPVEVVPDVAEACARGAALARETGAALLAIGSLYMVGDVRQSFRNM